MSFKSFFFIIVLSLLSCFIYMRRHPWNSSDTISHTRTIIVSLFFLHFQVVSHFTFCLRCFLIYSEKCDKVESGLTSDVKQRDRKDKEQRQPVWSRKKRKGCGKINEKQHVTGEKNTSGSRARRHK